MQFVTTIGLLAAATLTAAAPFSPVKDPVPASLAKRDNVICHPDGQVRLTEARVADIINDFLTEDETFTATSGTIGDMITCEGGTGVFLDIDAQDPAIDQTFNSVDLGNTIKDTFNQCYDHEASSAAGDSSFLPAIQYFGPGYNIIVHGSAC